MAEQKKKTEQEMREELLALELEAKRTQTELAIIELGEKKRELETRKDAKRVVARDAMEADNARRAIQNRCNHHQGGEGATALLNGAGDLSRKPCVSATKLPGDVVRIDCNRCAKEWFSNKPGYQEGAILFAKSNRQMGEVGYPKIVREVATTANA